MKFREHTPARREVRRDSSEPKAGKASPLVNLRDQHIALKESRMQIRSQSKRRLLEFLLKRSIPGQFHTRHIRLCARREQGKQRQGIHLWDAGASSFSSCPWKGVIIRPSPPRPWDALKGSTSASDRASLFISNPFFPGSCWPVSQARKILLR